MKTFLLNLSRNNLVIISFFVAIFVFFTTNYLLQIPPVWPDEAIIADTTYNLIHENRLGTDLWKGLIPESENHGLAYPPLFYYLLEVVFKQFGFSIYTQRLLVVFIGSLFIISFYFLVKLIRNDEKSNKQNLYLEIFFLLSLVLNITLEKAARVGRPDILVLLLTNLSLLSYFFSLKSPSKKRIHLCIAGFLLGLGIITHYSGVIYLVSFIFFFLTTKRWKFIKSEELYFFIIPALIPITIWLIILYPHIDGFWQVFKRQFIVHTETISLAWFWVSMIQATLLEKMIHLLYVVISWEFIVLYFRNRLNQYLLILLILVSSWVITFIWKIEYGFSLIIPAIYLCLWCLLTEDSDLISNRTLRFNKAIALTILLIIFNLASQLDNVKNFPEGTFSYEQYTNQILKIIPDNKTVYISAIPDPYFGFKGKRNNTLFTAPMISPPTGNMAKMLGLTDYVIYNRPLDTPVAGNFTLEYMKKNTAEIYYIYAPAEYRTYIYELKPRNQRVSN